MKLVSLHLRNFRQHADTSLVFCDGLTGILGANGEGKSTLLEGVAWALYGTRALRGSKVSVRWNRAPARHLAEATLEFELQAVRYALRRTESAAELRVAGASRAIAEGTSVVDAEVPRLVGMTYDEFAATYLCQQKDLGAIARMKGTARRQFFLQVMGVGRITDALERARAHRNELRRERDGLRIGLGDRGLPASEVVAAMAAAEEALVAEEERTRELGIARDALAAAFEEDARTRELSEKHAELARRASSIAEAIEQAQAEAGRVASRLDDASAARTRLAESEPRLAALPSICARLQEINAARARVAERSRLIARLDAAGARLAFLATERQAARGVVAAYPPADHARAEASLAALRERSRTLKEQRAARARAAEEEARRAGDVVKLRQRQVDALEKAGAAGECPLCRRALAEQFEEVLGALRGELDHHLAAMRTANRTCDAAAHPSDEEMALAAEIDGVEDQVRAFERMREESRIAAAAAERMSAEERRLAAEVEAEQARLGELPDAPLEDAADVEAEHAALERLERACAADRFKAAAIPELEAERGRWLDRETMLSAEADEVAAAVSRLGYSSAWRDAAVAALDAARREESRAAAALQGAESDVRATAARVTRAERALADFDRRGERLAEVEEQVRLHDAAERWFKDFHLAQASGIRPELEELTSAMVAQLTDGRFESVSLDEDFEPVLQRGGMEMEVVSGGEEDVVALAMRLATSQMIAERAGHPLSLLILDEPFGSQDEVRRANMVALIRRLGGVFEQVLVISHVEDVQEAVDRALVVRFDESSGRSHVEESRPILKLLEAA